MQEKEQPTRRVESGAKPDPKPSSGATQKVVGEISGVSVVQTVDSREWPLDWLQDNQYGF